MTYTTVLSHGTTHGKHNTISTSTAQANPLKLKGKNFSNTINNLHCTVTAGANPLKTHYSNKLNENKHLHTIVEVCTIVKIEVEQHTLTLYTHTIVEVSRIKLELLTKKGISNLIVHLKVKHLHCEVAVKLL
jgi:hypothetical protein